MLSHNDKEGDDDDGDDNDGDDDDGDDDDDDGEQQCGSDSSLPHTLQRPLTCCSHHFHRHHLFQSPTSTSSSSSLDQDTWDTSCSKWLEPPGFLTSIMFWAILPFELDL